jgi:hypothetical protein
MGYTHYWRLDKSKLDIKSARKELDKVLKEHSDILDDVELSDSLINFNGIGDNSHENLYISTDLDSYDKAGLGFSPNRPNHPHFGFCKTARKPYDLPVMKCLLILKMYNPASVILSSDGDLEEWSCAFKWLFDTYFLLPQFNSDGQIILKNIGASQCPYCTEGYDSAGSTCISCNGRWWK